MSEPYYKPCRELDICNELIEKYFNTQQYEKCFEGHLALAKQGYPLAELSDRLLLLRWLRRRERP